jgi:monoamine oxidase
VGGESIDDNHDAIQALLPRFGLTTVARPPDRDARATTYFRGRRRSAADYVAARGGKVLADYDRYYAAVDRLGDGVDPARPEATRGAERLDARSLAVFMDGLHLDPAARAIVEIAETSEYATEPSNLSLLFVAQQAAVVRGVPDSAVETKRIAGGNDGLPRAMASALGTSVRLGAAVTAIDTHPDHVRVHTRGGPSVDAARVVVALPPGPLRRVRFRPALPARVRTVVHGLDLGPAVKVMTEFPERFWARGDASGLVISDLPFHVAWDATDSVPSTAGILTTFTTGAMALRLGASTDGARVAAVHRQLTRVFPAARSAAGPSATHAWRNDRFTGGGYAFWRPGEFMDAWPVLREPVGRVHFAGEHTEALAGYMESAVRSGHRVAAAIGAPVGTRASGRPPQASG